MGKTVLLGLVLFSSVWCVAQSEEPELGVNFDLTYLSKWMSKGAEAYGQQGALFKTIDIDFYQTGFGAKVMHRNAISSGYVDKQRFDYRPYFKSTLFEDQPYAMNYNISAGYEHYPGLARNKANTTWEWVFAFNWPNLLPEGFVPSYIAHYEYPAGSNYNYSHITGWVHRFILGYDLKGESLTPDLAGRIFHLSSEIAYTDGLGGAAHDWSYATFGLSTKLDINDNLCFVPGVYQQISMDKSVCRRDDVTYVKLSMKYKF